jgi:polyferredoxin
VISSREHTVTHQPLAILDTQPARAPVGAAVRRPRRGIAALRGVQGFRRGVQAAVALYIAWVVIDRAVVAAAGAMGASPESICPFGGIETIVSFITAGVFVPHVHSSNVVLAVAVLLLAFLARGAFCGWICPLGFLQDLAAGASAIVQRHSPAAFRAMRSIRRSAAPFAILDRPLRLLKYAVLAWAIWGTAVFGVMVFRDVDPWIAILTIGRESAGFGMVVLVATLLGALFVDRPWCRYACPLGAANGLVARFSPVRLERSAAACVDCNLCTRSCPMGLPVATTTVITSVDCIGCLECVEACPRDGALELRVGLPVGGRA